MVADLCIIVVGCDGLIVMVHDGLIMMAHYS